MQHIVYEHHSLNNKTVCCSSKTLVTFQHGPQQLLYTGPIVFLVFVYLWHKILWADQKFPQRASFKWSKQMDEARLGQ